MPKKLDQKLYRSRDQKIIAGVAGGLAEYFNIDATLIRLAFVILTLTGGLGLIIYIILAVITPLTPTGQPLHATITKAKRKKLLGFIIIGLGLYFLINNLAPQLWPTMLYRLFWPCLLMALGCLLILKHHH